MLSENLSKSIALKAENIVPRTHYRPSYREPLTIVPPNYFLTNGFFPIFAEGTMQEIKPEKSLSAYLNPVWLEFLREWQSLQNADAPSSVLRGLCIAEAREYFLLFFEGTKKGIPGASPVTLF